MRELFYAFASNLLAELDLRIIFIGTGASEDRLYISASFSTSFNKVDYVNVRYMNEHDMTEAEVEHTLVDDE